MKVNGKIKSITTRFAGLPVQAVEASQSVTSISFRESLAWAGLALAQGFAVAGGFLIKAVL